MRHFSLLIISFYLFILLNVNFDRTHGKPTMSKTKMKESMLMNGPKRIQRKPRVPVANMYKGVHAGATNRLRRQIHIGVPTPPPVPRIPVPYPYRSKSETVNESGIERLPSSNRIRRQIEIRAPTPPPIPSIPGVGIDRRRMSRSLSPSDHSATVTGADQLQMIHHKYAYIVHNSKQAGF
ncbi:hypothetical protein ACQ4LE_010510 [Meloidogyne hapla]|uniref:Uncharacterized protein n=1 Tax=Meloidogyne hapla TaxID=6305 RepID=A0A1I8B292_MELHA